MIRPALAALMPIIAVAASAQSGGFQPLLMRSGQDTPVAQYSLRLADPDSPEKPTLWQGPMTVSHVSASCTADVSLVTAVYGDPERSFVIVLTTSGSNAVAHFIELTSCAEKWPPIKRAASAVKVVGTRLSFLPACEGGGKNAPASCTSARVYLVQNDAPPAYRRLESYKLTEREVGVGFVGEARVMDPHTPRALIVH